MLLLRRQRRQQQQQQLKTEKRRQKIYGSLSAHFRLAATCAAHNGRQTGTRRALDCTSWQWNLKRATLSHQLVAVCWRWPLLTWERQKKRKEEKGKRKNYNAIHTLSTVSSVTVEYSFPLLSYSPCAQSTIIFCFFFPSLHFSTSRLLAVTQSINSLSALICSAENHFAHSCAKTYFCFFKFFTFAIFIDLVGLALSFTKKW